jgi:hypothetical protein
MTQLFLDIETIPAQTEEAKALIAAGVKPPGNLKKAESIAAWEREQKPAAIDEAVAKSSFSGAYGQVCCIGWAWDDDEPKSMSWSPIENDGHWDSESGLLSGFCDTMSMTPPYIRPQIVGHHVAGFDIRFLWQRAMVLGIRLPVWFPRDPKPWSQEVFDTMIAWAGARDTISMDTLCAALGIPGKDGIDGSMVGQMFAEGRHDEIALYCRGDITRTRAVCRKMQIALGELAA